MMLPDAEEVLNHARIVNVSGLVYSPVVSAQPVVPFVVIAWLESGPEAW
jgi:hypothetical protein